MAELKEQALLERIGQLTVTYEDKIADLRVELTHFSQEHEELKRQLENARGVDTVPQNDVLEGTVVQ